MGNISTSSQIAFLIEIFQDEQYLSSATGFLWRNSDSRDYLVSNWHVFAGKNAETKENLDRLGRLPNRILVYFPVQIHENIPYLLHFREEYLLNDKNNQTHWLEHASGSVIDVGVLPLASFPNFSSRTFYKISDKIRNPIPILPHLQIQRLYLAVNQRPNIDDEYMLAGNEVFVVGFPIGGRSVFPLHKHATLATEPMVMIDNLPKILLDTGTRPGMSGAPIVSALGFTYVRKDRTGMILNMHEPTRGRLNFVGIYSGRVEEPVSPDPLEKQVGICWRRQVIDEIIIGGHTYPGP